MRKQSKPRISERDRLLTRPPEPLPTQLDPQSPEARGWPADPKPVPQHLQANPDPRNPAPRDITRSV